MITVYIVQCRKAAVGLVQLSEDLYTLFGLLSNLETTEKIAMWKGNEKDAKESELEDFLVCVYTLSFFETY